MLAAIIKYTKWLDFILCNVEINAQSGSAEDQGHIGYENLEDRAKVSSFTAGETNDILSVKNNNHCILVYVYAISIGSIFSNGESLLFIQCDISTSQPYV